MMITITRRGGTRSEFENDFFQSLFCLFLFLLLLQQQPGKLNMKNFQLVSDAVAKMNFGETYLPACESSDKDSKRYTQFDHTHLDGEDDDSEELAEYEQIYENEGIRYLRVRAIILQDLITIFFFFCVRQTVPNLIVAPVQLNAKHVNRMPIIK